MDFEMQNPLQFSQPLFGRQCFFSQKIRHKALSEASKALPGDCDLV
jgi:hypothetical protein